MMYQAWIKPGMKPSIQRRILMAESLEHTPRRIHTGNGGKNTERTINKRSERQMHIVLASKKGGRRCLVVFYNSFFKTSDGLFKSKCR